MKILNWLSAAALVFASLVSAQQPSVVRVKPGFATVIVCPMQPELVTVGSPENFSTQSAGNFVLVKPLVSSGSTNLFIKAGPDSYNLVLQVSDKPDLEIRLQSTAQPQAPVHAQNGKASTAQGAAAHEEAEEPAPKSSTLRVKDLTSLSPKTRTMLGNYLRTPRPYTYSVVNSGVVFAVDHMLMIDNKLYVIATVANNSKITYDVGYVRFKLIERASSYIFFSKQIKAEEIEPVQEVFNARVLPNQSTRLLFVFDKVGLSDKSTLEIKCSEESGRRDLAVNVPGSFIE
jgi:hypothetical protein